MYWKELGRLLTKNACYGCDQPLNIQESYICFGCLGQLQQTHFHQHPEHNELYYRLAGKIPLEGACSLFYFDKAGRLQRIINHLKYRDAPMLGDYLGTYYGHLLAQTDWIQQVNTIVPVPLHLFKKIKRGYNQSMHIARGLSSVLNIPLGEKMLKRKHYAASQTRLSQNRRWWNVQDAFLSHCTQSQHILLVDDIITTGATLEACIRALYQGDNLPLSVRVLSIGMARRF